MAAGERVPMTARPHILVIGGGGIGSRHLQALAQADRPYALTLVEPSASARETARSRFDEVPHGATHALEMVADLESAPDEADLCIVATPAAPRRAIVEQLVAGKSVRFLILEKVLFQARADYRRVADLLAAAGIPAWVNCPRRLWPGYREARRQIDGAGPVTLQVAAGRRAALGSNAIHFLDVLDFLAGGGRSWSLRGDRLSVLDTGSRHAGMVEFQGVLYGTSDRGDFLSFSLADDAGPHLVQIAAPGRRWTIREPEMTALAASESEGWAWREVPFPLLYQSALTGQVVADILDRGSCDLPSLATSSALHLALLEAFFQALSLPDATQDTPCPVT